MLSCGKVYGRTTEMENERDEKCSGGNVTEIANINDSSHIIKK